MSSTIIRRNLTVMVTIIYDILIGTRKRSRIFRDNRRVTKNNWKHRLSFVTNGRGGRDAKGAQHGFMEARRVARGIIDPSAARNRRGTSVGQSTSPRYMSSRFLLSSQAIVSTMVDGMERRRR